MTSSKPNYLPKVPLPNTITLGFSVAALILGGHNIQSITLPELMFAMLSPTFPLPPCLPSTPWEIRYTAKMTVGLIPDLV